MNQTKSYFKNLYDTDYHLWLETIIKQLRSNQFSLIDWENLIEELESMSRSDKRAIKSLLKRLLEHLLKLIYWHTERDYNANKWSSEITDFRQQINDELADSPSLKPYIAEIFPACYTDAVEVVARLVDKPISFFPSESPANLEQVLNKNWFPELSNFAIEE